MSYTDNIPLVVLSILRAMMEGVVVVVLLKAKKAKNIEVY